MHLFLAENIDGWLFALVMLVAGLGTTALALGGIAPAIFAKRGLTICLIAPAFLVGVGATFSLLRDYVRVGSYDQEHFVENFLEPWIPMGGLPLVTSLMVALVLFFRARRRATNPQNPG